MGPLRLAVFLGMLGTALDGQTTGAISGFADDPTGARVAGAVVTATNTQTNEAHRAQTDAQGSYVFPALAVGSYRIEVEAAGFKRSVRQGITLDVNQNARVDVRLEIGNVADEVKVTGEAPLVDTRQVQVGGLVDSRRVNELPLNGRNVYDLTSILPGAINTHFSTVSDNNGNYLNVNGSRSRQSTFLLDGAFNNDLWRNSGNAAPNPDAVEQFRLITANFNAEFGRSPGAVINVVTKSGTNEFHLTLWEFLRNSRLNARNSFRPTVAPLRQNQYGLSGGGPVIRNKTFFFGSWQGLKVRSAAFINSGLTPTAAERAGDFSAQAVKLKPVDPLAKKTFPGGIIPSSRLDPVAQKILALSVPLPNTPDGRLEAQAGNFNNEDQYVGKVDHQLNSAHKLYGTLFLVKGDGFDPFPSTTQVPDYAANKTAYTQRNVVGNEDWIATPNILNQARFSFTQRGTALVSQKHLSWSDYGSKVTLGALPPRPPQLFINGRWQMGTFGDSDFNQRSVGFSDTLSWIRNRHSIKAGFWYLRNGYDEVGNWLGAGQVRFNGGVTGNTLGDFLLGQANSFRQNSGQNRHFYSNNTYAFIQDDVQVSRRLTLNLGLRYEINTPFVSATDELQTFRFNTRSSVYPTAPLGLLFPGDPGIPRGVTNTDKNNFAPRFGLSYDVFGNGKTAIRAGYGIFYAIGFANFASDLQGQPFLVDVTAFGTPNLVDPWAGASPFPYTLDRKNPIFATPVTASYMDANLVTPYVQHYSCTIEQQLAKSLSLSAAYVGNTSRKLIFQRDANQAILTANATASNVNQRRPYLPGVFGEIAQTMSGSNSHYDSLQVSANKRYAHGFSILASYTFSKSIDEISDDKFNPTAVALTDSNNRRADRAVSDFNTPHSFVSSFLWELPFGFQLNGITQVQSGSAFNVVSGRDTNLDGNNNDRPNLVGNPKGAATPGAWFNTAAFEAPANGQIGTAGRNLLYGPGNVNVNAGIFKQFRFRERHSLQFRTELFNAFNHTNLGNPNGTVTSASFGRILSSGQARIVQFALKYSF